MKNGAFTNLKDELGKTPIWCIVHDGNVKIIQLFMNFKANVYEKDQWGRNLLFIAVSFNKNVEVVKLLLNSGLDIHQRSDLASETLLHEAVKNIGGEKNLELIKILLERGLDINARDFHGKTPLFYLIKTGNLKMVQLFLRFNASINLVDDFEYNLLFSAVDCNKNIEILQLLIDHGLEVNHKRAGGLTPHLYTKHVIYLVIALKL